MPTMRTDIRLALVAGVLATIVGCARREYLSAPVLADVQRGDPELQLLRVYPSTKFVTFYAKELGRDTGVGTQGAVETGYRAQRVEVPFEKDLPGAILAVDTHEGQPLLWVTFDRQCRDRQCALGFLMSQDSRFRLVHVPPFQGFAAPEVYRTRVAERRLMRKSRIYSKAKGLPVYLTTRGITASIALQIKKRRKVDIETVVVPQSGVPAG